MLVADDTELRYASQISDELHLLEEICPRLDIRKKKLQPDGLDPNMDNSQQNEEESR